MILMMLIMLVSLVYSIWGVQMHAQVNNQEARFHELNSEYWTLSKTERDMAPAGSELNRELVEIKNFPSELLRLKLIGVGKILTGIYVLLFGILIALIMMPMRLAQFMKGSKK
ncbi:hypothetical protein COY00_02240 [Candidatus Pacearchaeota archaeon CG_4_10_14_0_2_um_filter_35_33]|nr:MAG: hypothetical protein COY00_02240 [Candidatus Pacearchaeota archaeon CG_4_10_14_0_2_um_filter_35_33]